VSTAMNAKSIKSAKCAWCAHEWFPRSPQPPKICPVCKSINWQTGKGNRYPEKPKKENSCASQN